MSTSWQKHFLQSLFTLLFLATCVQVSHGAVPSNETFTFVNAGDFGEISAEFRANYRNLRIIEGPFRLCFYNTTPDAFKFAIRMARRTSGAIVRFVWEANRNRPVGENAKISFGTDGNLVLTDFDGTVVWETGTANKGVVGLKLLPNGNLVLHDRNNNFIWQSFDHPTDTLLVGQALRADGTNRLIGRASDADGSEGPFSLVMEERNLALQLKSKNSPQPLVYYRTNEWTGEGSLQIVRFVSEPNDDFGNTFRLSLTTGVFLNVVVKYNSTYSFVRVEPDGNLKMYTYYDNIEFDAWEITFRLFDDDDDIAGFGFAGRQSKCKLPSKCGLLGVCEDYQCVACPQPGGLLGYSKSCAPPKLPSCKSGAKFNYYKVVGVDHFLSSFTNGTGPVNVSECRQKCNMDCGCLGYFYNEESSMCLLAPELRTLIKVSNPKHVGYIKMES